MAIEECFEIKAKDRETFIDENILAKLPEVLRGIDTKKKISGLVEHYVGRDVDALSVLGYAAERGRFDEFARRLENHYQENLKYVHPQARRIQQIPGAVRAEVFFLKCYEDLGIKPTTQ